MRHFFRLFTLFWAGYFFVRAGVYLWLGLTLPLQQALAVRAVIGTASLAGMIGLSFMGRRLFFFCRWLGLLPEGAAETAPAASN